MTEPAKVTQAEAREEPRFRVDVDRIDELIDWALTKEWDADEGERIRREAW